MRLRHRTYTHLEDVIHQELNIKIFDVDLREFEHEEGGLVLKHAD